MRTPELEAAMAFAANNDDSRAYMELLRLALQGETLEQTAMRILAAEVRRLEADKRRLDSGTIILGTGTDRTHYTRQDLRASIDAAMEASS